MFNTLYIKYMLNKGRSSENYFREEVLQENNQSQFGTNKPKLAI